VLKESLNSQTAQNQASAYGQLPLSFEANAGQTDKRVKFLSRGSGYSLFLTPNEAVLALNKATDEVADSHNEQPESPQVIETRDKAKRIVGRGSLRDVLRIKLIGAKRAPKIEGIDELPGKSNYFIGKEPSNWRTDIPTYRRVQYQNAYPGVDVVYYGNQRNLEYDLIVAPRASYKQIRLRYDGLKSLRIDTTSGDLILTTEAGNELRQHKPLVYQDYSGQRRTVEGSYELKGEFEIAFRVGNYDSSKALIIDPVLVYSSFLGGTLSEQGLGVAVDSLGSAYITGSTTSTDFPVANAFQSAKGTADDAFVVKLNPAGNAFVYSTYFGGNGSDVSNAIAVDAQGNAYIAGLTGSGSFPTTFGAFQTSKSGLLDGFVTKLNASGSALVYSTFVGGDNTENFFGIAVDSSQRAYVVGRSDSTQLNFFPLQRHGSPVYKSSNSAANWSPSSTDLTASSVTSLAQDPVNSNTIYAGGNTGVFKSTDAGGHWSLTGTSRPSTAPVNVNAVVTHPTNSLIIYAAGNSGAYKSTDGGSLYDQKNSGLGPVVSSLAIDPITPTTLYAGTFQGIYKSTDGADTWTAINNGLTGSTRVNEIVIDPINPSNIYIGTTRAMFKSTNGGAQWAPINSGIPNLPEITALAIDPLTPTTLYAAAVFSSEVVYKSTNGGTSWTGSSTGVTSMVAGTVFVPTINTLAINPISTATLYAATSRGMYKSVDSGANWSQAHTGIVNTSLLSVMVDRVNPTNVYAGTNIGSDALIVRLNSAGSALEYLIGFGGDEFDEARGVAVDSNNNAYIVGGTNSANFPVQNAYQSTYGGASDAFVSKVNSAGTGFVYSTFLGGTSGDQGRAIAVRADRAHVAGLTLSQNFPLVNPVKSTLAEFDFDGFVTGFNAAGSALDFSTYLGGESGDQAFGIAVDNGGIYVTGSTNSLLYPVLDAPQPEYGGGMDAFVTKLNSSGISVVYSTYLGGFSTDVGNGIAVDTSGNAYVSGNTSSANFPTVNPFQSAVKGTDAFITKIGIQADLSIAKRDSRDPVLVNSPFTYTLTVNNNGPPPATGVTVVDTLPAGLTLNAATPTQGTCSVNNSVVTCVLGSVAANGGAVVALSVTPTATATITNTATVSGTEPDANTANNTASENTKISAFPSIRGFVKDTNNVGISGVLMTLTGTQPSTVLTDSAGFYQFAELPPGNYVITPTKANLSIDPESVTFDNLSTDRSADFVASVCTYSLTPATQSFGAAGNTGTVNVTSLHGCPWAAASSDNWITITSGATGVGSGSVNYTVSPTNAPRAGHLTIAGLNFPIYQEFNSCSAPSYSVATYNLSARAVMAATADLNGDSSVDVVVQAKFSGGEGAVLLNNGAGSFSSASFGPGFEPQGMAIGDFNSDDKPDLAFSNYNFSAVRILFNNGSGGFGQAATDIPFTSQGQSPLTRGLFSADLNNDGKPDLLVWTPGPGAVQVLLANGNGTFTQVSPVTGSGFDVPIGTADVNNDQIVDFIYGGGGDNSRPISVRIGNGSGGFGAPIVSAGMSVTAYMGTADFNGDGKLDLVVSAVGGNANTVAVLTGNGAGVFTLKSSFVAGQGGLPNLAVADFNRDGKPDVAFTMGGSKVTVLLGDGLGGLGNAILIDTGASDSTGGNFGAAAADFDGDSKPDIAVADYSRGASVLRNNCAASPTISGRVTDSTTGGVSGVTVTLSGAQNATTQTDQGGNYLFTNLIAGNYVVTPSKDNYRFNPTNASINNLSGSQVANFVATAMTVQFSAVFYSVGEGSSVGTFTVNRSGDTSGPATVQYATSDTAGLAACGVVAGKASERCDYVTTIGTLSFAAGETSKTFSVPLIDDTWQEGFEDFRVTLSSPTGALLGSFSSALISITDNDGSPSTSNPIDGVEFFIRQMYKDILNRQPDSTGLQNWINTLAPCPNGGFGEPPTSNCDRLHVAAGFFQSDEFLNRGYFAFRFYMVAFNQRPLYSQFIPDMSQVGGPKSPAEEEAAKVAYANAFVQRPAFMTRYPGLSGQPLADALLQTAGLPAGSYQAGSQTNGQILRGIAQSQGALDKFLTEGTVSILYFGFQRRDPDTIGYQNNVNTLNADPNNLRHMIFIFIYSTEYRGRFGPT
jgi:uncharacterized repeat protein (TIGR01451 family)